MHTEIVKFCASIEKFFLALACILLIDIQNRLYVEEIKGKHCIAF